MAKVAVAAAWVAATAAFVWVVGWLFELVQFAAARLPALTTVEQLSLGQILSHGALSALLILGVLSIGLAAGFLVSLPRWDVNGPEWHDIVTGGVGQARANPKRKAQRSLRVRQHWKRVADRHGALKARLAKGHASFFAHGPARLQAIALDRAGTARRRRPPSVRPPREDWPVRVVAGFNVLVVSALLGLGFARAVGALFPIDPWASLASWLGVLVGVGVFLVAWVLFTLLGPLVVPARLHALFWVLVALAALFASAPVGVLVLSGVIVSTVGRRLARGTQPHTAAELARSPGLWVLLGITTLLGVAYSAMPPVPLPAAMIRTSAGELSGGYIARQSGGIYLVTCTGMADATSVDDRLTFVPANQLQQVRLGGGSYYLDSGERPSLGKLALHALGLGADPPTVFDAALRARQPTCGGAGPAYISVGSADPALGAGVITGPAHPPRDPSNEAPIQSDGRTPANIAALARAYQPTILVTVADRNWPVSLNAVLAEQGPDGQPACLVHWHRSSICPATAKDLHYAGASSRDYLQLPVALGGNRSPSGQFQAFLRGEHETSGTLHRWLSDPGRLDPWYSAQIYFYDAGPISGKQWQKAKVRQKPPPNLIGFEYWFYYPFNYYPLVIDSSLMNQAPIAGDLANNDLHQGDWEHVDVLLDPRTDKPAWLYTARHSGEGQFFPWSSPALQFDDTHPVVQAAFGGHPTYLPGCGPGSRPVTLDATVDWLSCGSGRFAFRATSTPLVNLQTTNWACWPGYFGEATPLEVNNSGQPESVIDTLTHLLYAAGPLAPVVQAENSGRCHAGVPASAYSPNR